MSRGGGAASWGTPQNLWGCPGWSAEGETLCGTLPALLGPSWSKDQHIPLLSCSRGSCCPQLCCPSQLPSCQQRKHCPGHQNLLSSTPELAGKLLDPHKTQPRTVALPQPALPFHTRFVLPESGDFLIYCLFCIVIFQCRLIAVVTAPGRREDYLINVCEALLDPHMKAAKKRNV